MYETKERQPIIKQISNNNKTDKDNKRKTRDNLFTKFGQNNILWGGTASRSTRIK
jgi:hypothetical protein